MKDSSSYNAQILKGLVGLLVLGTLQSGESYGYEITSRLRAAGLPELNEGTVYPVLARMEKEKLLSTHLVASTSGPARKYYRLTATGRSELQSSYEQWRSLAAVVDAVGQPVPET